MSRVSATHVVSRQGLVVRSWLELATPAGLRWLPVHWAPELDRLAPDTPLTVHGDGHASRDWLYVEDHVRALRAVFERGAPGRSYNVGGNNEKTNLSVVETICTILDDLRPRADGESYTKQIGFVADRPGHDARYAIDAATRGDDHGGHGLRLNRQYR